MVNAQTQTPNVFLKKLVYFVNYRSKGSKLG